MWNGERTSNEWYAIGRQLGALTNGKEEWQRPATGAPRCNRETV